MTSNGTEPQPQIPRTRMHTGTSAPAPSSLDAGGSLPVQTRIHTDTLKKAEADIAAGYAESQAASAQPDLPGTSVSAEAEDFGDVAPPPQPERARRGRKPGSTNTPTAAPALATRLLKTVTLSEQEQDAALADTLRLSRRNNMVPGDYIEYLRGMVVAWDLMLENETPK